MKIFSSALLDYNETEGTFPGTEEGLKILMEKEYVTNTKFLDPWKVPYEYALNSDGTDFTIKSLGADKKEGGTGVNKDIVITVNGINNENSDSF